MTDKILYQQIRKLVRQQKEKHLERRKEDFAQEYCRLEMMKKKQLRQAQPARINHLFKNFQQVESYINIMDIIRDLNICQQEESHEPPSREELPELIPKSIQMKIKQQLGPVLNQKYEEEAARRNSIIEALKSQVGMGNSLVYREGEIVKEMDRSVNNDTREDKMDLINVLRKDIKKKQVYFIEKKFDDELREIAKVPTKIQNTKIFHKVCSYMHMILEQEHKEKWASRQDKQLREARRLQSKQLIRVSKLQKRQPLIEKNMFKSSHSRFYSPRSIEDIKPSPELTSCMSSTTDYLQDKNLGEKREERESEGLRVERESEGLRVERESDGVREGEGVRQQQKKGVRQNFTFRRRNVKANLMTKINQFVEGVINEQKKNGEVSKRYGRALQSLSEELKTSYNRFEREELAHDEDVSQMKKYLDNTLSRNKNNLKKFHRA